MSPDTIQLALCGALRYFQGGQLATLRRIVERVSPEDTSSDAYFSLNLMTALNVAGLVDLLDSDLKRQWWSVYSKDVEIRGCPSKIIPTTRESLQHWNGSVVPLISTTGGKALIFGAYGPEREASAEIPLLGPAFGSRMPTFRQIERHICEPDDYVPSPEEHVQRYDTRRHTWVDAPEPLGDPSLIRVRPRFSGTRQYIWYPELAIRFRILRPEWAFFAAAHLLGQPFRQGFRCETDTLIIQRAFRVPALVLRFLFASSQSLRIGAQLEFSGVAPYAIETFVNLFSAGNPDAS